MSTIATSGATSVSDEWCEPYECLCRSFRESLVPCLERIRTIHDHAEWIREWRSPARQSWLGFKLRFGSVLKRNDSISQSSAANLEHALDNPCLSGCQRAD